MRMAFKMATMDGVRTAVDVCLRHLSEKENENPSLKDVSQFRFIVSGIANNEVKLFQLIECLGPHLTNIEVKDRIVAMHLFADVLHNLSEFHLNFEEISHLVEFCCDRLKDQNIVIPHVIRSLVTLSSFASLPIGCALLICKSLFQEVQAQYYDQQTRKQIYTLIANLLRERTNELQEYTPDFIFGFIQTMDGEKDPRCLLIVFNIVPFILKNFKIGHFAEEFFEVVSCYFPIDFTPPPNNPHGISKSDLVLALRQCLAATPLFAQFCFPLLIEKLDSAVIDAKIDALETLVACSDTYGAKEIKPFYKTIWNSIRREVFVGTNNEVEAACLKAVTALMKTASSTFFLEEFLQEIFTECEKYLREPELKLMHSSARILIVAASASDIACQKTLLFVIPLLVQQFNVHAQFAKKKIILEVLNEFLILCKHRPVANNNEVSTNIATVVSLYLNFLGSTDENLCQAALIGFDTMLQVPDLLSSTGCDRLIEHFMEISLKHSSKNIRYLTLTCLRTLTNVHREKVEKQILPKLFEEVKGGVVEDISGDCAQMSTYYNALDAIAMICITDSFLKIFVPKLINHIESLLEMSLNPLTSQRITRCIDCLHRAITNAAASNSDMSFLCNSVIEPLLPKQFTLKLAAMQDRDIVKNLSSLFGEIARNLPASKAQYLIKEVLTPIFSQLFNSNHDDSTRFLVIPVLAIICAVPAGAFEHDVSELFSKLDELFKTTRNEPLVLACVQMLASIVNKHDIDPELDSIVKTLNELVNDTINEPKGLNLLIWLTKALILKGYLSMEFYINKLIQVLSCEKLGQKAAEGFDVIVTDNPEDVLSIKNHAVRRLMYRQRFYQLTSAKLIDGFHSAETNNKRSNHLVAILHQLRNLPQQVLADDIQALVPLLSNGLITTDDPHLLITTLNTFEKLMSEYPASLVNHVTSLIPHFLRISQDGCNLKIRMTALQCLNACCLQPSYVILPLKNDVISGLRPCLDDKKRLVRQIAVKTRGNWFLLGAPGPRKD